MLLNCGVGEDSWESLGLQGDPISPSYRKSILNSHWKDWCWSWNSNTLATWCEEPTHWKRPWCWERLRVGGEGDDRGWDGWMASLTQWTWIWVSSGSWWWTRKPDVLQTMWSQRVRNDWVTELNWTEKPICRSKSNSYNWTWNNALVQNWGRSTSRLYIVTLLILLTCRVLHAKCQAGWITSWNQVCWEKYQQPQIGR